MTRRDRLRLWAVWGTAAFGAGLVCLLLELRSNTHTAQGQIVAVDLVVGWSFAVAGLIAWTRRPENNTGRLLLIVSFTWFLGRLEGANDPTLYSIGAMSGALVIAAFVQLVLAYPTGRLQTHVERVVVVCGYVLAVVANLATLAFDAHPGCDKCPTNIFLVSQRESVSHAISSVADILAVVLIGFVVFLVVQRYRAATPVARRALRSIAVAGGVTLTLLVAAFAAGPVDENVQNALATCALLVLATVPFWFLAGLLRSRLARGGVAQLLLDVRETASLEEAQDGLRRALNDPDLRLASWVDERRTYVDPDGRDFEVPTDDSDRVATLVTSEDGTRLAVIVHDRALLDEPDLFDAVVAAGRVALHRNRLQAELRGRLDELQRERDFMRDVVNAAPAFFCVLDTEGAVIRFNDTLVSASGIVDDESVRGRPFWDVFPVPEDAAETRALTAAAEPGEHEHRWRAADGGHLVVAWSFTPVRDSDGVERLVVTGADVSERVHHEDALRRERDFLTLIGNSTPTLLCVVDSNGVVTERGVNSAFAAATGEDDRTAIGRTLWDLVIPTARVDEARDAFLERVATGSTAPIEGPWRTADGDEMIVEWWPAALEGYREEHYLICGIDITRRKHDEDELRRSRARLVEAADAERRRLERNLHDGAQQRLVSLSLALRLAESKLRADPESASTILAGASDELAEALRELRELARGLHPAVLTDRGLAAALEALADRSPVPVELDVDVDRRLPGPAEVAIFYVVSEALANVAKYAGATSAVVRVDDQGGEVEVEVADDGAGGADPALGTGLCGLVDRVEALDGELSVDSPAGGGTRIRAVLPLAEVREPAPQDAG